MARAGEPRLPQRRRRRAAGAASAGALLALALGCRVQWRLGLALAWGRPAEAPTAVLRCPPRALQGLAAARRGWRPEAALGRVGLRASAGEAWAVRRDHMILPAARVVSPGGTQGSGFVVSCGENGTFVLTNHHVIKDCIQQSDFWDPLEKSSKKVERLLPVSVETFRYDERGRHLQTITTSAEVVAYAQYGDKWDFEGDLALLKLRTSVDGVLPASVIGAEDFVSEVRMLDEVVMVGCPDGSELPMPTTGHVASLTEERAGVGLLLSQVFGNPGSSGSAVYRYSHEREAYEVVAVHSMVDSRGSLTDVGRGSFLRLAVPAPKLHEFLSRHGFSELITPAAAEGETSEEAASEEPAAEEQEPQASPAGNETANETAAAAEEEPAPEEPPAEEEEEGPAADPEPEPPAASEG